MERFEDFYDRINMDDWEGYDDVEETAKTFEIKDASTADWAISKINDERKRTAYFIECAKNEINKLKEQIKDMEDKCERSTTFLSSCLGRYLEREDVPKKTTKTQESVTLPAGKIIKKLPKIEYVAEDGKAMSDSKTNTNIIKEIKEIDDSLIATKEEISWGDLKKKLIVDGDHNVMFKDTGEIIESIIAKETLPSIEITTE